MSRQCFKVNDRMNGQFRKVKQNGYCMRRRKERRISYNMFSLKESQGCFIFLYIPMIIYILNYTVSALRFDNICDPVGQQPESFLNLRFKSFATANLWSPRFDRHCLVLIFHTLPIETKC